MSEKTGRQTDQPDEWQQDLNPDPMAGQNYGLEGSHPEKDAPNASEIKDLHLPRLYKRRAEADSGAARKSLGTGREYIDLRTQSAKSLPPWAV